MTPQKTIIECPACHKEVLEALHYPAYTGHSKSSISAKSITVLYKVQDKYEIISDCPNCGRTKNELQKWKPETNTEKLKNRLKAMGISSEVNYVV